MDLSHKNPSGYTILEVLVFLSITGFLLLSALTLMGGRQAQVQYRQGITDLDDKILSVANDVSNGFFPSQPFSCSYDGIGGLNIDNISAGEQGTREDCVFIGKAISLDGNQTLVTTTLTAWRAGLGDVLTLDQSLLTPLNGPDVNLDVRNNTTWGLQVNRMYRLSDSAQLSYVAYLSQQGSMYSGSLQSGNQPVGLYGSVNPLPTNTGTISSSPEKIARDDEVILCISSDSVEQNAVIILGREGRDSAVMAERDVVSNDYPECGF